jgi:aryl-alcohol dehydrogenase-like predicted oxidoreductase
MDLAGTRLVVERALDLGVTLFDTADTYGERGRSEDFLGQILGARRKSIVLASKFGMSMGAAGSGASRRYIMTAVEASLKRLKTDWLDLYQLHTPDAATPIEETLRALEDLIRQGKVRHIGCSNFSAAQLVAAQNCAAQHGLHAFITCQNEYSLMERGIERELLPAMAEAGVGLLPYYLLASGLLTGKYKRHAPPPKDARLSQGTRRSGQYLNDATLAAVERLEQFCRRRGHTLLELAFGWLAAHQEVSSIIAGATRPEQVEQNVAAIGWSLDADEMEEVDRLMPRRG